MATTPTRDTNGYSGLSANHVLGMVPFGKPFAWQIYEDDFHVYLPGGAGAGDWTLTETGSGTQVVADEAGGVLLLTTANGAADRIQLQLTSESFLFPTAKQAAFMTRIKVGAASDSIVAVGLATEQATTNFFHDTGDLWVYDDGVLFRKDDGTTTWDFAIRKNDIETEVTNIATVTTSYIVFGFYYNGADRVTYYTGAETAAGSIYQDGGNTNWPEDAELTPTIFCEVGTTTALALSVDYIWCGVER
ncbi:MAG: hypothetical protein HQ498_15600 [Pseudohongiella sp.]|nr:hypothetical protein [Pseudohongiella sp.]